MGSLVYRINDDNFYECIDVCKEVFWMYYDIVSMGCIMHGVDYETVNFKKYIMCEIVEERLKTKRDQNIVKLVRDGCFVALCCDVLITMEEKLRHEEILEFIGIMLGEERIEGMQYEKDVLIAMKNLLTKKPTYFIDKDKYWSEYPEGALFYEKLDEIYKEFILGQYQLMLGNDI